MGIAGTTAEQQQTGTSLVFIYTFKGRYDWEPVMTAMLYLKSLISNTLKPTIQHLTKIVLFMTSYWTCFSSSLSKCWWGRAFFSTCCFKRSSFYRYGSDKNHIEIRFSGQRNDNFTRIGISPPVIHVFFAVPRSSCVTYPG